METEYYVIMETIISQIQTGRQHGDIVGLKCSSVIETQFLKQTVHDAILGLY